MCGFVSLPCIHVFLLLTSEWRSCFQVFCFAVLMKLIYVRCFGFSGSAPFSCCAAETRCSGLQFATWLHRFPLGLGWACTTSQSRRAGCLSWLLRLCQHAEASQTTLWGSKAAGCYEWLWLFSFIPFFAMFFLLCYLYRRKCSSMRRFQCHFRL